MKSNEARELLERVLHHVPGKRKSPSKPKRGSTATQQDGAAQPAELVRQGSRASERASRARDRPRSGSVHPTSDSAPGESEKADAIASSAQLPGTRPTVEPSGKRSASAHETRTPQDAKAGAKPYPPARALSERLNGMGRAESGELLQELPTAPPSTLGTHACFLPIRANSTACPPFTWIFAPIWAACTTEELLASDRSSS